MTLFDALILQEPEASHPDALAWVSPKLEDLGAKVALAWACQQYGAGLVLASSFGAEDMVLIDLLCQVTSDPHIFYLDTELLFPETYDLIQRAEARYGFSAIRVAPRETVAQQEDSFGPKLWERQPDQCCYLRKVEPLQRFLADKAAWITGIRRDQTALRSTSPMVGRDDRHQLVKINPLVRWTAEDVYRYLQSHDVPYNPLHDQGYPSIGCMPCTVPVEPGQDPRRGRWAGQEKTECGLHL